MLSIVMPVLNETAAMAHALQALAPLRARGVQLIVVDGGSADATVAQARLGLHIRESGDASGGKTGGQAPVDGQGPSQVIHAPRGRATQMNVGAQLAQGAVLLFLHADTQLPPDADALITRALADGQHVWGRFDVRIAGQPWMLRVIAALMNRRSRWSGIATGDQALFMTRAAFDAVGGFPDQALMEDIAISKRLLRLSRPACLRARVLTSGRRWETRGVWRTVWLMWRLRWAYWRGASPDALAERYR
jgi:rSAM/selenodomain-associated transferase 2